MLACLAKVDPRDNIPREISITAQEYSKLTGINIKNAHRELYKASDALWTADIILFNGNEKIEIRWIQKRISKVKGEGSVIITWSDDVLKYISSLQSRFTSYKLRYIATLQSGHSIRLYELLMKFKSTGERVIYLNDFKSSLGLSDKYYQFKELNKFVIKPSIKELNERSDLIVSYEAIKKGRSVVALSFEFKTKK